MTPRGTVCSTVASPTAPKLAWAFWLVMPRADDLAPTDTYSAALGLNYLNNLAFWSNPGTEYTLGTVPFTADMHRRIQQLGGIYNADSPDLQAFRAHGGKIIIHHSWADQAISPFATLNYYGAVARRMGGYATIQDFSRLYMVPGLYHCPCSQTVDGDPANVRAVHAAARALGRERQRARGGRPARHGPDHRRTPDRVAQSRRSIPCSPPRRTTASTATTITSDPRRTISRRTSSGVLGPDLT